MKRSIKGKAVIQYKEKPLLSGEGEEQEMERQKVIEDIEVLEYAVQNIMNQYSDEEIRQDFEIIEKRICILHGKYSCV